MHCCWGGGNSGRSIGTIFCGLVGTRIWFGVSSMIGLSSLSPGVPIVGFPGVHSCKVVGGTL